MFGSGYIKEEFVCGSEGPRFALCCILMDKEFLPLCAKTLGGSPLPEETRCLGMMVHGIKPFVYLYLWLLGSCHPLNQFINSSKSVLLAQIGSASLGSHQTTVFQISFHFRIF